MKQKLLLKTMLLLCLLVGSVSSAWATEEVYKTLTFCNAGTNNNKTSSYTSSWTETVNSFGWTIANFNNNNWGWNDGGNPALYVVKCGRKKGDKANTPSVATITTNAAIDQAITKVVVTLTAINVNDYNSIKLYMASTSAFDKDNDEYFETIEVSQIPTSAGNMTITIPEAKRVANRYYKIAFDTKGSTSSNGHTGIKKVEYYYNAGGGGTSDLEDNDLTLNAIEKEFDLKDGANQTFQLTNTGEADGALTFKSSDNAVATVSNTGLITAVAVGTAKITVTQAASDTYKGGSAECVVTVTDSRLNVSDMTFTSACGGSGTADDGAVWTVTSDAKESLFGSTDGLHYGTGSAEVQYVQLSTSDIGGQVSKVVVRTRDTQACATVSVTVGGVSFTCSGSTTATNTSADYTFTGTGSGTIIVRIDRGSSKTSAIWVKGVKVTYLDTRDDADLSFDENEVMIELKDKTYNALNNNSNPLLNPNNLTGITWSSSDGDVATVNENGLVSLKSEGQTVIKASFAGNDSYKPGEASFTLNVVDNRQEATVTWKNATGADITELNVEKGQYIENITLSCNVSSFTFTDGNITYVWGNNGTHDNFQGTMPAGYMSSTNSIWTQALGTIAVTATFPGNDTYKPASATLTITVTGGTSTAPYTVAEARAAIDANSGVTNVYAKGIVCTAGTVNNDGQISYYISDDGTETNKLHAYKGKGISGANFTSNDDIQVGDVVVIYGTLKKYNSTYEFDANNQLVSLVRKPAAPTFSPVAGAVAAGTAVTISTKTDGATIYYTTDGTDPTFESSIYSEPIVIDEALTIKAFAVKDALSSNVATAAYTIAEPVETPTFSPAGGTYTSVQDVTISTTTEGATIYYTTDGKEPTTASTEYTKAISVDKTMTIKAIAVKEGMANSEVASATFTINLPDYATLPFEFDGGTEDFTKTYGLTQDGLGSDYSSSPKLKFDGTGDYVVLKIDERPGTLTFDIKGNSFSGGTSRCRPLWMVQTILILRPTLTSRVTPKMRSLITWARMSVTSNGYIPKRKVAT